MPHDLPEVHWAGLSHAYGPASDTADLLRQLGAPDREAAEAALAELYGSIFHQGTVYPATVAAVPFLAESARTAPHGRADLVWLLGQLADPQHAYGEDFPAVRAAVAACRPVLLDLLPDPDPEVREAAAYAAARAGAPAAALWQRWPAERSEPVRASLALGLGLTDPTGAQSTLTDQARHGPPALRLAAAIALLRAGLPWPPGTVAAVAAAVDAGATIAYWWARGADWSDELLVAPAAPVAVDLLRHLLASTRAETRRTGLWAAAQRCDASRSAPAELVPLVAAVARDPDPEVRRAALDTLSRAGAAAGPYADLLAEVAAGYPQVAGGRAITVAHDALGALTRLGDPRWIEPVCAAAAAGHPRPRVPDRARRTPVVLDAVRRRLAAEPARADVLAGVLGHWRAEAAVPELRAALPYAGPEVAGALLAIGYDDPRAAPYLRARAAQSADLAAAAAVLRITGDVRPLRKLVGAALAGGLRPLPGPVTVVADSGEALRPLLPAARARLTGVPDATYPQREAQILAARVVAALDGVPPVLATVRAVLAAGHVPARAAADLVADLAPAHRDTLAGLRPVLRDRLGDRWCRVAAARALARLGVPTADLTQALVAGVTDYAGRFGLATIRELSATETVPLLAGLADGDGRLDVAGSADDVVWSDEALVEELHATIAALRDRPARDVTGAGRSR
ncbi:hypothetical protein [Micromonospora auratinigra]|uniref:hypothetical protein n=1 Tax=Micromonospora auratinigra TaxID=261654 RepID=UPI000B803678|nr:hypothetical protein [Micromonospora auratinigra]